MLIEGNQRFMTLGDADAALRTGLQQTGYVDIRYLSVPSGFALVTRLERIRRDGTPLASGRFSKSATIYIRSFSLRDYLSALFTANLGRYRVIAIIVTDTPFTQGDRLMTPEEAGNWMRGFPFLPKEIRRMPWTPEVKCIALVYEFLRSEEEQDPTLVLPGNGALDALTHLKGAGLWNPRVFQKN